MTCLQGSLLGGLKTLATAFLQQMETGRGRGGLAGDVEQVVSKHETGEDKEVVNSGWGLHRPPTTPMHAH